MKKSLLVISIMLVFAISLMGCATTGDLEKVQAQEKQTSVKADQALQAAQDAKAAADAAKADTAAQLEQANTAAMKAADAAARAENAVKMAEERAKVAEEKAKVAEEKAKKADVDFPEINEEVSQFYGEPLTLPLGFREKRWQGFEILPPFLSPPFKSVWTIQAFNLSSQDIRLSAQGIPNASVRE